jgi:hypothetical protein
LVLFSCGNLCRSSFFLRKRRPDPNPVDPVKVITWKDALGLYGAEGSLKLTINEAQATDLKTLALAAGTGEGAKITLTNIVPDQAALEIDNVTMVEDGENAYTFSAEATVGSTTVAVAGSLSGIAGEAKTLALKVTRSVAPPLTGEWKLRLSATGEGTVYANLKTANESIDQALNAIVPLFGSMLNQSVSSVKLRLGTDGLLALHWTATDANSAFTPDMLKQLLNIHYFTQDGKLYLAVDKSQLPRLYAIPLPEGSGVDLQAIVGSLAEDRGGFVAFPLGLSQDTDQNGTPAATFFVGKDAVQPLAPLIVPALAGGLPAVAEEMLRLIQQLPEIVSGAETFDLGLTFVQTDAL